MSVDGTYTGLKASVADFLNRSDLTAVIPDFIVVAEAQMMRRFVARQREGFQPPRRMILRSDASIIAAAEFLAVPTDFFGPVEFVLKGTPEIILDYLDPTNFQQWKEANALSSLAPRYYTVVNGEFQIYPVADIAYTVELTYIKRLAAASTSTNFILTDYPDAYLYGALVAAIEYLNISDARKGGWETKFSVAVNDICNADPMPSDKSTLRTEFPSFTRLGRTSRYDINSDLF